MNHDQDPNGLPRLQGRARDVFARAARMQDLHAQALTQTQTQTRSASHAPESMSHACAAKQPQLHLNEQAACAVINAHGRLQEAADLAHQLARTDPLMLQLQARINGSGGGPAGLIGEVLDMELAEVSAPEEGEHSQKDAHALAPRRLEPPQAD